MIRLGLSQSIEVHKERSEQRDFLDNAWIIYLQNNYSCLPVPLPNSIISIEKYVSSLSISAVIITGGRGHKDREKTENQLVQICLDKKIPLLGICHGMHMINSFFGGSTSPLQGHVRVQHKVEIKNDLFCLKSGDSILVNSYHENGIFRGDLSDQFVAVAEAEDGSIELMRHKTLSIYGLSWHPEREQFTDINFKKNNSQLIASMLGLSG